MSIFIPWDNERTRFAIEPPDYRYEGSSVIAWIRPLRGCEQDRVLCRLWHHENRGDFLRAPWPESVWVPVETFIEEVERS